MAEILLGQSALVDLYLTAILRPEIIPVWR